MILPRTLFDRAEVNTMSSIKNYVMYGFEPGSYVTCLLGQDFNMALQTSHPGNTDVCQIFLWIQLFVPEIARNHEWKGFENETPNRKQMCINEAARMLKVFHIEGGPDIDDFEHELYTEVNPYLWMKISLRGNTNV